jgi:parallel beta-helix repeat protein
MEPLESRRLLSTYVVTPMGNDNAAGNASAPFASLQRAANVVQPGDTVTIEPGRYNGFDLTTSGTAAAPITFIAQSGAVIDGRNPNTPDGINLEGASYVTIQGFTVSGISRAGIRSVTNTGVQIIGNSIDDSGMWGILTGFSENVEIENNVITGSVQQHGIYVGNSADNPVITGNTVSGNNMCGIQINSDASQGGDGIITGALIEDNYIFNNGKGGGSGINLDGVQDSIIQDNLLYDNHATGIALYKQDGAASPKGDVVVNNTIVMADDARWAMQVNSAASAIYLANNIILNLSDRNGGIEVSADSVRGLTSDFNAVVDRFSMDGGDTHMSLADWRQETGQDQDSILATPDGLFVNFAKNDFHLAEASPASAAGTPKRAPQKDIEGNPAADARHPSIGAFQQKRPKAAGMIAPLSLGGDETFHGWKQLGIAAGAAALVSMIAAGIAAKKRNVHRWLMPYLASSLRPKIRRKGEIHILLCVADHYEPQNGDVPHDRAMQRVTKWVEEYPLRFGKFRDSDGRPPRHSFFYPLEQFDPSEMAGITQLCRQGYGEVEVHLHHDHDTAENLHSRLARYTQMLAEQYGLLSVRKSDGRLMYGFIHGNWALDNSRPDGRWCGIDNEIEILKQTGCYCDFTLPSAPNPTQVRTINRIYYAREDGRPRSHERGMRAGCGKPAGDALMLIQGPLVLNWNKRKWGILPRIENGCIQGNQWPTIKRLDNWIKAAVQVPQRPDWYFVKLHTHGAPDENSRVLLGPAMVGFHTALAKRSMFDSKFCYHYVTAREMYNLARAAEDGWTGSVADARDYELVPQGAANHAGRAGGEMASMR